MSTAEKLYLVAHIINYIIAIPMTIAGIIGAILAIIVFTRQHSFWHNTTINYLLAGSILAGIHFLMIDIQTILVGGFEMGVYNTNEVACREHTYFRYVTTVSAICFPCWAAFDQYAGTSHDATFRNRWRSIRFVRLAIIGTVLSWILIYIPMIFVSEVSDGICILKPSSYTTFNTYALTPLVHIIVPAFVMIYYTRGTIQNLRSGRVHNSHEHLAKQVRRMLMPQLFILVVSGVPFGLEGIYYYLTNNVQRNADRQALENVISQIIMLLYHVNYTFSFYIYVIMSSEVRKAVRQHVFQNMTKPQFMAKVVMTGNSIFLRTRNTMTAPLTK